MIIKVFSDTHNDHDQLVDTECDILIHCGDACIKGNYSEGRSFLEWFVKQPAKYKILVPGNHDKKIKTHPDLISLAKEYGIIVLNDGYIELMGLKMYGGSFVPSWERDTGKPRFKFDYAESRWKDVPEGLDILITHVPPRTIMDRNRKGFPCGCPLLYKRVNKVKPKLHLFGHIHEEQRKVLVSNEITFVNCCNKDRNYFTNYTNPITIEYDENNDFKIIHI